jgi:hypothetical protein
MQTRLLLHGLWLQLLQPTDATWAQKHPATDTSDPYIARFTPQTTRVNKCIPSPHTQALLLHWMNLRHNKRVTSYTVQPLPISLLQQRLSCLCRTPQNQAHLNITPLHTPFPQQRIPSHHICIALLAQQLSRFPKTQPPTPACC